MYLVERNNVFLTVCLLAVCNFLTAANWFPQGAKWHFTEPGSYDDNVRYRTIEVMGDTIINGINVKKLTIVDGGTYVGQEYVYESNDSVFYYNRNSLTFKLMYNFNSTVGDTVVVEDSVFTPIGYHNSNTATSPATSYEVDSVELLDVGGEMLSQQSVSNVYFASTIGFYGKIMEKVGSMTYLFPNPLLLSQGGEIHELLRCYQEPSGFSFKNPNWTLSCDTAFTVSSEELSSSLQLANIYPNPANQSVVIDSKYEILSYTIIDLQGKQVKTQVVDKKLTITIDLSGINTGLFIIELVTSEGSIQRKFQIN